MKALESLKTLWRHSLERVVSWRRPTRFEIWANRDTELIQQWFTAYQSSNYGECEKLQTEMRENWRHYREAS